MYVCGWIIIWSTTDLGLSSSHQIASSPQFNVIFLLESIPTHPIAANDLAWCHSHFPRITYNSRSSKFWIQAQSFINLLTSMDRCGCFRLTMTGWWGPTWAWINIAPNSADVILFVRSGRQPRWWTQPWAWNWNASPPIHSILSRSMPLAF